MFKPGIGFGLYNGGCEKLLKRFASVLIFGFVEVNFLDRKNSEIPARGGGGAEMLDVVPTRDVLPYSIVGEDAHPLIFTLVIFLHNPGLPRTKS